MKSQIRVGGLALMLALPGICAYASTPPSTITLTGTLRDFISYAGQYTGITYDNDFENVISDDRGIVGPLGSALGADGTPVYAGGNGTVTTFPQGSVTAAGQFYPWYHDDPTYNLSKSYSITLNSIGGGQYQYVNNSFFPLDGQLFGNGKFNHNFSFTYQVDTTFTYNSLADFFSFSGDDDVYVYIDDKLVINLGGVHGDETEGVALNTLGLTLGDSYSLDVFFAERHTTGSDFAMTTSLQLQTAPAPDGAETAQLLAGALSLLALMRSRLGRPSHPVA